MKAVSHLNSLGHQLKWILKKCKQAYKYLANGTVTKKQEKKQSTTVFSSSFLWGILWDNLKQTNKHTNKKKNNKKE